MNMTESPAHRRPPGPSRPPSVRPYLRTMECRSAAANHQPWDVGSAHRWRFVASGFDALQEVPKVGLEVCLIVLRIHAVDARCPILAGSYDRLGHSALIP